LKLQYDVNKADVAKHRAFTIKEQLHMQESYFERDRGYGQGNIRIGESLEMDDSIYSLGFLSQICDEIIDERFDVITGQFIDGASASSVSSSSGLTEQAGTAGPSESSSGQD